MTACVSGMSTVVLLINFVYTWMALLVFIHKGLITRAIWSSLFNPFLEFFEKQTCWYYYNKDVYNNNNEIIISMMIIVLGIKLGIKRG